MGIGRFMQQHAQRLDPGCFAAVMATGIASIDAAQHGLAWLARALLALNLIAFAWLLALSLLRLARFRRAMLLDLRDPARGAGYLTFVAATCVLGSQCLLVIDAPSAAWWFWLVGAAAWIALIELFFAAMISRPVKPDFAHGINGGWLVTVVATEAVAALATLLAARAATGASGLLFFALCAYLIGAALYLLLGPLLLQRMVFHALGAHELRPPYWITMGALAIITLAGSLLVRHAPLAPPLADLVPFVKGLTLLAWVTASWWIPLLAILWFWRHGRRHVPLRYEPDGWNIAFPIGMYAVGTFELARALDLEFLRRIAAVSLYVNLLVWALLAGGFVVHVLRGAGASPSPPRDVAR